MENKQKVNRSMKKRLAVLMGAAVIAASGGFAVPAHPALADSAAASAVGAGGVGAAQASGRAQSESSAAPTSGEAAALRTDFATLLAYKQLSTIVADAAALSDKKYKDVIAAISSGSTLAEATGMDADAVTGALLDRFARELEADVSSGVIARRQADRALQAAPKLFGQAVSASWSPASAVAFRTDGSDIVNRRLASIVQDAAFWADKSPVEVRQALRDGGTLLAAAQPGEDDSEDDAIHDDIPLTDYLVGLLDRDLDAGAAAGKLTAEDAAKRKQEGAQSIGRILDTAGYEPEATEWMKRYGQSIVAGRLDAVVGDTAALSEGDNRDTDSEADAQYRYIADTLSRGGNLVSASGLSESELLSQLVAMAEWELEKAWADGSITAELAEQLKTDVADRLSKAIGESGYGTAASADAKSDSVVAEASIRRIIEQSASYAELSADKLRGALKSGQTLEQAAEQANDDLEDGELLAVLQSAADAYIDDTAAAGALARVAVAPTQAEARGLLEQAVATPGYVPKAAADAYVQERLARVVADAAKLAGKPAGELLRSLAQGLTFAEAAGTDNDGLLHGLLADANRELTGFVADGSLTEEESEQALSSYTAGLVDLLTKQ